MCTLREMVNIIVWIKVNNKWVMLVILIIFDVNKKPCYNIVWSMYSSSSYRDYYQSVFGYRQYHVLGIKIVLCEPLASIIHYFLFPIHDTADTQRHEGNNLFII